MKRTHILIGIVALIASVTAIGFIASTDNQVARAQTPEKSIDPPGNLAGTQSANDGFYYYGKVGQGGVVLQRTNDTWFWRPWTSDPTLFAFQNIVFFSGNNRLSGSSTALLNDMKTQQITANQAAQVNPNVPKAVVPAAEAPATSSVCGTSNTSGFTEEGITLFLICVAQLALRYVLVIAAIFIILAGYIYMTSFGNKPKIEQAKNMLLYTIVGILVVLGAYLVVNTLLKQISTGS